MALDLAACMPAASDPRGPKGVFAVQEIPDFTGHFVGRDDVGHACLLLGSSDGGLKAPLRLSGLKVQYALTCTVRLPGCAESRRILTIVRCTTAGDAAERYFLHVMATLVGIVGPSPTLQGVAETVTRLAAIFQKLHAPARESVTGVVGELVIIFRGTDAAMAVDAWRTHVDERYDFVRGRLRLEAKSSMTRRRVHGLSFEQCAVPENCRGIIASLFVEESAGGTSLESLLDQIGDRLVFDPIAMLRLEQTLAETLGVELPAALGFSFDLDTAIGSLAFYEMDDIPAIRGALAPGVSRVRFTSDLSACLALDPLRLAQECGDFAAFVPLIARENAHR